MRRKFKKRQVMSKLLTGLSRAQEITLDERMKKYEDGFMKFSSWTEVKKRVKAK